VDCLQIGHDAGDEDRVRVARIPGMKQRLRAPDTSIHALAEVAL
jgi:hypothetical protein